MGAARGGVGGLPCGHPFLRLAPGEIICILARWADLIGHRICSDESSGSASLLLSTAGLLGLVNAGDDSLHTTSMRHLR